MGEVAEAMLDGTLCQKCGGHAGEPIGFPRDCNDCRRENNKRRGIAQPNPVGKRKLRTLRLLRDGDKPWSIAGSQCESLQCMGYVRRAGDTAQITNAGLAVLERAEIAARANEPPASREARADVERGATATDAMKDQSARHNP